jgi:streptomycin 6-kinase
VRLPASLARTAADEPAVLAWTGGLPSIVCDVAALWSLAIDAPFDPGGTASWVAPARTATGADVVVKIAWRHYEADHEADGLREWNGRGVVQLLDFHRHDELTDVLLLEACDPGTSATMRPETEQDEIVAAVLRAMWIAPAPDAPFRPLSSMCDAWVAGTDVEQATTLVGDPGIVRAGLELFTELAADPVPAVLLATDLHAGNILAARRAPWLAVDPKPYVGDRTYDPLQHLLNCTDRLVAGPQALVERMAVLLDLDATRLMAWLFARCVIGCPELPELAAVARASAPA